MDGPTAVSIFLQHVDELRSSSLGQSGLGYGFTFKWNQHKGFSFEGREPAQEQFRSYLMTIRHFISEGEPCFFHRIHNIVFPRLESDELRRYMIKNRESWQRATDACAMGFYVNGARITPQYACDVLMNGVFFHNDAEKRAFYQSLPNDQQCLFRQQVYEYANSISRVVIHTANIINRALSDGTLHLERTVT